MGDGDTTKQLSLKNKPMETHAAQSSACSNEERDSAVLFRYYYGGIGHLSKFLDGLKRRFLLI